MDSKQNPLAMWEIDFIRTSCRILDINSEEMINSVPDKRCWILLKVVLVRRWVTWDSGNLEGGGFGERVGKGRSVYKQPETEVDGSCHS